MKADDIVLLEEGRELQPAILITRIAKAHSKDPDNIQIWKVRFLKDGPDKTQLRAVSMVGQREIRRKYRITKQLHSANSTSHSKQK